MWISRRLYRYEDTCNVYLIRDGRQGVLVDVGSGDILDHLGDLGVDRVTDVLVTHHHRDQVQGLPRAVAHGARIWVPPVERELFTAIDLQWQARELYNNYNTRQDRFSLLEPVPISGTLPEYRTWRQGAVSLEVVPTPGHTVGSVSLLGAIDGQRVAFTGDLIAGPGKVWSLAATQWTYNRGEGIGATVLSALDIRDRDPDLLLPSHGQPMGDPRASVDLLVERLTRLAALREEHIDLVERREHPYGHVTPHLLRNLTSVADSYVLVSESRKALVIDFGYDSTTGLAAGSDRAARRPSLYTIPALKERYGVDRIDVAIPTHYHDDHVAGFNLLREIEGTRIWASENVADVLRRPARYDLPCLWFDPIPVDRVLPTEQPFEWEEYRIVLHPLPGHTLHAVAIELLVDGKRVLALGDQLMDEGWVRFLHRHALPLGNPAYPRVPGPRLLNYVYRNGFQIADYRATAELYLRIRPDLLVFGHWPPVQVDDAYLAELKQRGESLEQLHRDLLPLDEVNFGAEGFGAWLRPYQAEVRSGGTLTMEVGIRNPFERAEHAVIRPVVPSGWSADPDCATLSLAPRDVGTTAFALGVPSGVTARRARVAVDLSVGGRRFGQQAEAVVSVL